MEEKREGPGMSLARARPATVLSVALLIASCGGSSEDEAAESTTIHPGRGDRRGTLDQRHLGRGTVNSSGTVNRGGR